MSNLFIRRLGQEPFEIPKNQVVPDIKSGKLSADDEISPDGQSWISLGKHKQLSALFKTGPTSAPAPTKPREKRSRQKTEQTTEADLDSEDAGNFIIKLWKGEYPLRITFWVFVVAIPLGFSIVANVVLFIISMDSVMTPNPTLESMNAAMKIHFRNYAVIASVVYVYLCIVFVGLWRSANDYEGRDYWRIIIKIIVVLYVIGFPVNMFMSFQFIEMMGQMDPMNQ